MQEINELKNLVIQSLEGNGVLGQIRAQIRSSVFKIIEMQETNAKKNAGFFWENRMAQTIYNHKEGSIVLELIHDFLEFFKMDYTMSVFVHESNLKDPAKRDDLAKKIGINKFDNSKPLLFSIVSSITSGENFSGKPIETKDNIKMPEQKSGLTIAAKKEEPSAQPAINNNTNLNNTSTATNNNSFKATNIITNFGEKDFDKKENANKPKNLTSLLDNREDQKPNTKKNDAFENPNNKIGNKSQSMGSSQSDTSINDEKEKKKLAEAQQKIKQMEQSIKSNKLGEIPAKLNQGKENSDEEKEDYDGENDYEGEEFEDNVEEELFEGDDIDEDLFFKQDKTDKKMLTSSEDVIAQSQSQGFDVSVDSLALEEYDYYEDAEKIKQGWK